MKRLVAFLLLVLPVLAVLADDVEETLKKARELERRAGVLLDQGKRGQAFDLLAQAAQLRDEARAAAKAAKPKKEKKTEKQAPARRVSNTALEMMDLCLEKNDLKGARRYAEKARKALGRWAGELAAEEKRLRGKSAIGKPLLKRVESLEKQLAELHRMIRNSK